MKLRNLPRVELVAKMMGKELDDMSVMQKKDPDSYEHGELVYEAAGLSSEACTTPLDFKINKGEVNGFTGLLGSGRSESVRAIFGADKVTGGQDISQRDNLFE